MDYIDLLIKAKIEQAKNKGEREKRNPATIYKKKTDKQYEENNKTDRIRPA